VAECVVGGGSVEFGVGDDSVFVCVSGSAYACAHVDVSNLLLRPLIQILTDL